MKKCKQCGQELPDNVAFCPECGTKQEMSESVSTPTTTQAEQNIPPASPPSPPPRPTPPTPTASDNRLPASASLGGLNADMLNKAAFAGALLVIISSFLPLVSILGGLGSFSVSELSGLVTAGVIVFAGLAFYFHAQGQLDMMPIIGTGLLLLLVIGFVEYHSAMDEVSKFFGSTGKTAAKAAFSFSAGFYAFTLGSVLMCLGGSGCLAHKLGLSLDFPGILAGWREALQRTIVMGTIRLPGWIGSLIVTGILVLLIRNIKL